MGAEVFHVGATAQCPHSGQVSTTPGSARVSVGGQKVATLADNYPIDGCTFMVANKPQPCKTVQWQVVATRVKVDGQAVILSNSSGLCLSAEQAPQGPPSVLSTQRRVTGI